MNVERPTPSVTTFVPKAMMKHTPQGIEYQREYVDPLIMRLRIRGWANGLYSHDGWEVQVYQSPVILRGKETDMLRMDMFLVNAQLGTYWRERDE